MGKHKKAKYRKKKSKYSSSDGEYSSWEENGNSTNKRGRSGEVSNGSSDEQSPNPKIRKTVQVTVHNDQIEKNKDLEQDRHVTVRSGDESESQNLMIADSSEGSSKIRTRSSGELTEAELNAELPQQGKSRKRGNKTKKIGDTLTSEQKIDEVNNKGMPVKIIQTELNPAVGHDGVQIQVERVDDQSKRSNENSSKNRASSTETDTSSDSSSDSTGSTSSSDEKTYRWKGRKMKKKTRKRRKVKHPKRNVDTSSESDDDDSYHLRLLEQNPGLKKYVEKSTEKSRKRSKIKRKKRQQTRGEPNKITSPSVETLYTPAVEQIQQGKDRVDEAVTSKLVEKGIRQIRLNNVYSPSVSAGSESTGTSEEQGHAERDRAIHEDAERLILELEKFKAVVTKPSEDNLHIDKVPLESYDYENDANFLTSTCHVEPALGEKITYGKWLELDKLLNKRSKDVKQNEAQKMELMNKDGLCYWGPAKDNENKITGIRRWEEAFKVYMMIYTKANPTRASEILAYADIIAGAGQTFTWENVSNYDFYFRKLMENSPGRSWARTHTQLWTLTMKDHLPPRSKLQGSTGVKKDWREIACWRFNQGKCTKQASDCKFEHRCLGCGSFNHVYSSCFRKKGSKWNDKKKSKKDDRDSKDDKKDDN